MAADVLFLEYPKCSTCQKAKKWLDAHGVTYADRHIVEDNPTADELRAWHERSGLPLKRFFNTSGMLYREMELSKKLPEMSEDEQYALLATNGMLVKRPLLVTADTVVPGFKEAALGRGTGSLRKTRASEDRTALSNLESRSRFREALTNQAPMSKVVTKTTKAARETGRLRRSGRREGGAHTGLFGGRRTEVPEAHRRPKSFRNLVAL